MTPSSCHQGFWLPTLPAWPRRFPAVPASHTSAWRPCARSCSSGCSLRRGGRGRRRDGGRPLPRVRSKKWWLRRLSASTRDRMCWEIRQHYLPAQAPGHFLLKGHRKSSKVDVVVGEADPSSFLILYYQKGRSISVKLYGRTSLVSDAIVDKFEQRIRAVGLSEDVTYYFPTYGGWHTVLRKTCDFVTLQMSFTSSMKRSCRCRWSCQGDPELSPHLSQLPMATQT
ncbi:complement component C8 gamma chain isoform X4 [Motacilla alba alba]|uniref:complement component C8 gamma chain isoform X4 n=1 Tax=Motacilla alba alba TaxID=1094192 RepID=UPI0018D5155C|nr:complement component C8 gamma chain isoform X4 [Motacilla alba alba]